MSASRTRPKAKEPEDGTQWVEPGKPNFVSLKAGQFAGGIYLGPTTTRYGVSYRFAIGDEKYILSGNRVQLDRLMEDLQTSSIFPDRTPIGHYLRVERKEDVESASGHPVATFRIGHVTSLCPKCTTGAKPEVFEDDIPF